MPAGQRAQLLAAPGFGRVFTDHMITRRWPEGRGWHDGRLEPYGPLNLDPATSVFHYAQEILEGAKAYRQRDGSVAALRPQASAARFRRSAARMTMPQLPGDAFTPGRRAAGEPGPGLGPGGRGPTACTCVPS